MNILVSFNNRFTALTKVMLRSLIANNHCELHIYVLYLDLSDDSKKEISSLRSEKVSVHFIEADTDIFEHMPQKINYSKETYGRLFSHLYLPEHVERILWLDSDLIINGPIDKFYNQSFNGKLYVACRDRGADFPEKKETLGMPLNVTYINSGVLLMNPKEIRANVKEADILDFIKDHYDDLQFADQDVFNGLLYDSFKVIKTDRTYNFFVRYITLRNLTRVYKNTRILHYVGINKPIDTGFCGYGFLLWWKYAFMTDKSYRRKFPKALAVYIPLRIVNAGKRRIRKAAERCCPKLYEYLLNEIKEQKLTK